MQFLHHREYMEAGAVVVVDCDHQCNVQVMGDADFAAFRSGHRYSYQGGFYRRLPARVAVPHSGWWNVTLDLAGGSATIRHSIRVLSPV